MKRTDQIKFDNATFTSLAPYPPSQTPEQKEHICKRKKYGKVKMLLTIGVWEGPSGKQYLGEWLTKDDHHSSTYSCQAKERFNLYRKRKDGTLSRIGKFKPVHSCREEGGEHIPVMSWQGWFEFRGADYEWEGSCVWELSTLLSDWDGMIDNALENMPDFSVGVAKGAKLALKKAGANLS